MRFWLPNFYDNYYKVCNQVAPSYLERTCNIRLCFPRYQDLPMMRQPLGLGCGLYIITPVGYCHLGRTDNVFLFFSQTFILSYTGYTIDYRRDSPSFAKFLMSTCTYMYAQNTPLSFQQSLLVENQNLMKIHKYFLKIQNCVLQKNLR